MNEIINRYRLSIHEIQGQVRAIELYLQLDGQAEKQNNARHFGSVDQSESVNEFRKVLETSKFVNYYKNFKS